MSNEKKKPDDHLEAVFKTVIDEARNNPAFAKRIQAALAGKGEGKAKPRVPQHSETPHTPDVHAVNILRQHGEQMLRGRLSNLRTKADLLAVAKRSGLRLTGTAAKKNASRPDIIDGIVIAAHHYDSQREAAEG